ncbi:MAG: type II toxin-antitoxin system HicB family antitoxin [Burkholderiaceae bacterium]|nr:type II toxin-antitoxin system HicB family antitoxin [Burkholderiaceae bacterium]
MLYTVYVHTGDADHAHGVTFPDFPGCFAAADRWDDLPAAIQEAVQAHFCGEPESVPAPTPLEQLAGDARFQGGGWLLAEVDLNRIDARPVRLNISLPAHLVQRIDAWASAHHMTRSGLLGQASLQAMAGPAAER